MNGNIVGQEVYRFVSTQIENRQRLQGSGTDRFNNTVKRSNKVLNYLNTRNAWVKLASGIGIDSEARQKLKDILISDGYVGTGSPTEQNPSTFTDADIDGFLGKNLEQNFILFNTFQYLNEDGTYKTRSGVIKNKSLFNSFNSLYGGMGFKDQGLQPIPGIIDVSVECVNRGAIKKATVTLKAYNKFQFSVIETLYLRLGYIMMLEYGWDKYVNNIDNSTSPPTIDIQNTGTTLIDREWFKQEEGKTPSEMIQLIELEREKYQGNYDGFLGKVTNFEWKLNSDLTYDITINLITLGSVITSLAANPPSTISKFDVASTKRSLYLAQAKFVGRFTDPFGSKTTGTQYDQVVEDANNRLNLKEEYEDAEDLKLPELGADAISKYLSDIILNFEDLKKVSKDFVGFEDFIPGSLRQATQYHKTIQKEKLEEFTETANELEGKYYIRFGKFLTDFFIRVNKYTKDPNTNLPNPELVFEENEEIICNYETNFIPVDPTICLFSPVFTKEVYEELYPLANSPSSNLVSSETEGFGYDENSAKIWNFFNVGMEPYVNKNFTLNSQSEENAGGTIVVGRLMNLYVNIDFLLDELVANLNTKGQLSIFTFLENICNGINRAMCNITQIEPSLKNNIEVNFIEQNLPKGYNGMLESIKIKNEDNEPNIAEFELVGYNPTTGASNFVKDFNFITKITPDLQNIISIGAAATNSSTKSISALPLNNWNKGLINRYQEEFEDKKPPKISTTAELERKEKHLRDLFIKKGKVKGQRRKGPPGYQKGGVFFSFKHEKVKIEEKLMFGYDTTYVKNGYKNNIATRDLPGSYKNGYDTEKAGLRAYIWDTNSRLRGYIISKYDIAEQGLTEDGFEFIQSVGSKATDYISYIALCFSGRRSEKTEGAGAEYVRATVAYNSFSTQWYKQNPDFINLGKSLYRQFKEKVDKKIYQDEGVVTMTNGFIPLQFQMTVEGLAGVKIYNKLNIDQRFLPSNYPESLSFIATKVNHKISDNNWATDYECLSIPASTNIPSDEFRIFENKRKFIEAPKISQVDIDKIPDELKKVRSVRGPHSPDISTINEFSPSGLMYFNEKTNKTQIVLHHTATDNIGRGSKAEVEAIMKYWRNDISPPNTPYPAVSTHWIADREGNGVKVMDYIYWSRNSGVGDSTAKNQLSVELCSSGWLKKNDNGEYINSSGRIIPPENVSVPYKLVANRYDDGSELTSRGKQIYGTLKFEPVKNYRGFAYFEEYTDDQIKLLKEILISMTKQFYAPILQGWSSVPNLQTTGGNSPKAVEGWDSQWSRQLLADQQIVMVGLFRSGYTYASTFASFIAGDWYNKLFPDRNTSYSGAIGNGLFTHNTFSTKKSDIFPSKKLITMLIETGVNNFRNYDKSNNPYFNSFPRYS